MTTITDPPPMPVSLAPMRWNARNIAFVVLAYGWTALMCLALLWILLLPRKAAYAIARIAYMRVIDGLEKVLLGVSWRVQGWENLPPAPALIAMKHESQWETLKLPMIFRDPTIVLKIELLSIPLWGWYARKMGLIAIDRSKRAKAVPDMIASAKARFAEKRDIVIFPQGTRVPVGEKRPYKPGIRYLYEGLACPVVPVAINSGCFVTRQGLMRRTGIIDVVILPPIMPGLDGDAMMHQLEKVLEQESARLTDQSLLS